MRTHGLHFFRQSTEIIPGVKTGLGTRYVTSLERWSLDRLDPGKAGDALALSTKSIDRSTSSGGTTSATMPRAARAVSEKDNQWEIRFNAHMIHYVRDGQKV